MSEETRTREEKIALIEKHVDGFAQQMKQRMIEKVDEKRHWQDGDTAMELIHRMVVREMELSSYLKKHKPEDKKFDVEFIHNKLIDIANFAMMGNERL